MYAETQGKQLARNYCCQVPLTGTRRLLASHLLSERFHVDVGFGADLEHGLVRSEELNTTTGAIHTRLGRGLWNRVAIKPSNRLIIKDTNYAQAQGQAFRLSLPLEASHAFTSLCRTW